MKRIGMHLTQSQLDTISNLAKVNSDIKSIAIFMNLDPQMVYEEYMDEESELYKTIEAASKRVEFGIDKSVLKDAMAGDKDSIKIYKESQTRSKFERYKSKLLFDREVRSYEALQAAVEHGMTNKLPENLQKYYEIIDYIRTLYNGFNSKTYIVNAVRLKWKDISISLATKLYYESINFFNLDNEVKKDVWARVYADKLDVIAALALEKGDLDTAGRYLAEAAKMRGVGKEEPQHIPEEILDRRPVLYTIKLSDLGIAPVNRKELAELIDNLDISERDRTRLKRDAMIEDIEFENIENGQE